LDACSCSYMTGVATENARAHPALKLLGVKASMATARRHMIYVQASNPMCPPSLQVQAYVRQHAPRDAKENYLVVGIWGG
jgi:hypothetical protein